MTLFGLIVGTLFAAAGVFLAYVLLSGLIWGAGFEPVPRRRLGDMMEFSGVSEGMKVYDLGSGFGRIVFEAARRHGARCVGVEIDPLKCWWSRREARRKHLEDKVEIRRENLFDVDISSADIVFVFLFPPMLKRLKEKMLREMRQGKVVVSYSHKFPAWEPERAEKKLGLYVYRIPAKES